MKYGVIVSPEDLQDDLADSGAATRVSIAHAVMREVGMGCAVECGDVSPGVAAVRVLVPLRWFFTLGIVHVIAHRRAWPVIMYSKPAYVRMRLGFGLRRRVSDGRIVW
jgi:hypothetical protein